MVLNQLEAQFYGEALAKFQDSDFTAAGFPFTDIPKQIFKYSHPSSSPRQTALTLIVQGNSIWRTGTHRLVRLLLPLLIPAVS